MSVLKLVQTTSDGRTKSWKLESSSELLTFGTSRKARITSIDNNVQGFESVFEFRNSEWHYISFSTENNNADVLIDQNRVVEFGTSTLNFEIINKNLDLLKNLEAIQLSGHKDQQLVLISKNNALIGIHVKDPSTAFNLFTDGKIQKLNLPLADNWATQNINDCSVKYKKISTDDLQLYKDISRNTHLDKESKTAVIATLAVSFLLITASLLAPDAQVTAPVVQAPTNTLIVRTDLKKKFKKEKQHLSSPKQEVVQNKKSGSAGGAKVSALLKGSLGVRISKLLSKVSATEARTANVLVSIAGVKTGEGTSGRALAALGKIEASGRNWNGEASGSGRGISTAGIGGGNGSKGLGGGLGQGKTGSGGVGLIEDESEIIGGLDREIIAQYIKTQLGQILYCYERQLSANPNLYGKIAVKFTIAGTGQVETQSINDTTLKNSSVESCILSKISKWKFPEPKGGTKVLVTYPFLFKSTI